MIITKLYWRYLLNQAKFVFYYIILVLFSIKINLSFFKHEKMNLSPQKMLKNSFCLSVYHNYNLFSEEIYDRRPSWTPSWIAQNAQGWHDVTRQILILHILSFYLIPKIKLYIKLVRQPNQDFGMNLQMWSIVCFLVSNESQECVD